MAAYSPIPISLVTTGHPQPGVAELVTGNYFSLLGVKPAMGRFFLPGEDSTPGGDPATFGSVVIILLVVALVASAVPAWRASRLDLLQALDSRARCEVAGVGLYRHGLCGQIVSARNFAEYTMGTMGERQ